ncbi:LOB domain-containing protein 19-like [Tasmannia lanceolata]|uniref:LOB domain-containing protein 19-like n=1 Tax=Tasmannia lanceolata TaxID=3420 RepID=UPI004062994F
MSSGGGGGGSGPCGACKFLRRKCVLGCIFAPYFDSEQGSVHFAAVHKVFGASNVTKLLLGIPDHKRLDAVVTICFEAHARLLDPVYGCVSHIFSLQQQVVNLQAELAYVQTHLSSLELPTQTPFLENPPTSSSLVHMPNLSPVFNHQQRQQLPEMTNCQNQSDRIPGDNELQALAQQSLSKYFNGVKSQPSDSG